MAKARLIDIDTRASRAWRKQENWYIGMSTKDIYIAAFRQGWNAAKKSTSRRKADSAGVK